MNATKITNDQRAILALLNGPSPAGDHWFTSREVAELCDHWFNTSWASGRLRSLHKRGLVDRSEHACGYWRISQSGRWALSQYEAET